MVELEARRRLLSFWVGADDYALEVERVREIVPFSGATWLPGFAAAVRGVVELRGEAVAVVELAAALGLDAAPATPERCLLVVEAGGSGEPALVGLLADGVRDIVELAGAGEAAGEAVEACDLSRELAEQLSAVVSSPNGAVRVIDLDRLLGANPRVRGPVDVDSGRGAGGRGERPAAIIPHLVCAVGAQPFALPVLAVERIARFANAVPVPAAPPLLRGLQLVESDLVAVLDLSALVGGEPVALSADSCVLVVGGGGEVLARGLLVEGVERVVELAAADMLAPPGAGGRFAAAWIAGLARGDDGLLPILDLAGLLSSPAAVAAIEAAGAALAEAT
jgi:purine-binding chemotaxis protein CheW